MPHDYMDEDYMAYNGMSSQRYMLPMSGEMKEAMDEHKQHHYPESYLDGKTVPYYLMDKKHKGRR